MTILLDVRLNIWAGYVMFYADRLLKPSRNKVLYTDIAVVYRGQFSITQPRQTRLSCDDGLLVNLTNVKLS